MDEDIVKIVLQDVGPEHQSPVPVQSRVGHVSCDGEIIVISVGLVTLI